MRKVTLMILLLLLTCNICWSGPAEHPPQQMYTSTPSAAPAPPGTGNNPFISKWQYHNTDGSFVVNGPNGPSGLALYKWTDNAGQTTLQNDTLTFMQYVSINGYDINNSPQQHIGAMYKGVGNGNTWYLVFCFTAVGNDQNGKPLYPVYYSWSNQPNTFARWLTPSGTSGDMIP